MKKIIILLILSVVHGGFDPSKVDYCKVKCASTEKNTACDCKPTNDGRTLIMDDIVEFRTKVLERHNKWRQIIASGEEKSPKCGKATNMMAMSYDLELEYMARTFATHFVDNHDKNRCTSKWQSSGQNLGAWMKKPQNHALESLLELIDLWYAEVKYIDDFTISVFNNPPPGTGHFTQVVWATDSLVGCARLHNPNTKSPAWTYVIICNYGGSSGGNMLGVPVYIKGNETCSQCPYGPNVCNEKYNALCGEIAPIPTEVPPLLCGSSTVCISANKIFLVFILLLSIFSM